jgi:hypothetical protein
VPDCIEVRDDAGDFLAVLHSKAKHSYFQIRDLRIDTNPLGNRTCRLDLARGQGNYYQFSLYLNADQAVIDNIDFDTCSGVNTVVTYPGNTGLAIRGSRFRFVPARGATYYDNSLVYALSRRFLATGNEFVGFEGRAFATGAVEVHAQHAVVSGNLCEHFEALCNIAPDLGSTGPFLCSVTGNVVRHAGTAVNIGASGEAELVQVVSNLLHVAPGFWRRYKFAGITSVLGDAVVRSCDLSHNVVAFEPGPIDWDRDQLVGTSVQDYACMGIGIGAADCSVDMLSIRGNQVAGCPASALAVFARQGRPTLRLLQISENLLSDCAQAFASPVSRAYIRIAGDVLGARIAGNLIHDGGHADATERFWLKADQGRFRDCYAEHNRVIGPGAAGLKAAYTTGWVVT